MEAQLNQIYENLESSGQTQPEEVLKAMKAENLLNVFGKSENEVRAMLVAGAENGKVPKPVFKEITAALLARASGVTSILKPPRAQAATTSQSTTEALGNAVQKAAGVIGEVSGRLQEAMDSGAAWISAAPIRTTSTSSLFDVGVLEEKHTIGLQDITAALAAGASGATSLVGQMLDSSSAQAATTSQTTSGALGNAVQQAAGVFGEVTDRLQEAMGQEKK